MNQSGIQAKLWFLIARYHWTLEVFGIKKYEYSCPRMRSHFQQRTWDEFVRYWRKLRRCIKSLAVKVEFPGTAYIFRLTCGHSTVKVFDTVILPCVFDRSKIWQFLFGCYTAVTVIAIYKQSESCVIPSHGGDYKK